MVTEATEVTVDLMVTEVTAMAMDIITTDIVMGNLIFGKNQFCIKDGDLIVMFDE
jgi:hypothetical protein